MLGPRFHDLNVTFGCEEERPVWERSSELCLMRDRQLVVCERELSDHPSMTPEILDRRGVFMWTEEDMIAHAAKGNMGREIGDLTGLYDAERWNQLEETINWVTQDIYDRASNGPAMIAYETCRDDLKRQNPILGQESRGHTSPKPLPKTNRRKSDKEITFSCFGLPERLAKFATKEGCPTSKANGLIMTCQDRLVNSLKGSFKTWCVADVMRDSQELSKP